MYAIASLQPQATSMVIGLQETRWNGDVNELLDTHWGTVSAVTSNDPDDADRGRHGIAIILTGILTRSSIKIARPSPRLLSIIVTPALPGIHRFHVLVGYAPASSINDPMDTTFHK